MHESLIIRRGLDNSLLWLMVCLFSGVTTCLAQPGVSSQPGRRPANAPDPFRSLLTFVRQEQEIEFAKPLPEFPATVQGAGMIERQVRAAYPAKKELAVYSLDWEPTLAAARKRAAAE